MFHKTILKWSTFNLGTKVGPLDVFDYISPKKHSKMVNSSIKSPYILKK